MLKVGLTGGIGSGKSTVANLFRLKNVDVIDADKIARDVVSPGSEALNEITQHFGLNILNDDKSLNRAALREIVFNNAEQLKWLNQCLHPRIRNEINAQVAQARSRYVILDIPLLFENNLQYLADRVLVVDVPEDIQIARVTLRDGSSPELVKSIMSRQVSRQHRLSHADDVIDNTQSLDQLKTVVGELHQKYLVIADNA